MTFNEDKRIARYSLDLLTTEQKINFLADFYTSVVEKEFDDDSRYGG